MDEALCSITARAGRRRRDLDVYGQSWGVRQAEDYIERLRLGIEIVASYPNRGRRCDDVRKGYLKYRIASHVLFYRLTSTGIDVVRILHHRSDFGRHL